MSRADEHFLQNCRDILTRGVWDTDQAVRPRWTDGTPAHTVKLFGVVNRYDLREEFPILTVRKQYLKSAIDELLGREPYPAPKVTLDPTVTDFYAFTKGSFTVEDYRSHDLTTPIEVAV